MKPDSKWSSILGGLLEHCPPYVLGGAWAHFEDKEAFRGPEDAGQAWTALNNVFNVSDLLEAGVAVEDKDGNAILNPVLYGPDTVLVALRTQENHAPFALLTPDGCIPPGNVPAVAALEACPPERLAAEFDDILFAAFSIEEVVALRSLGLRATLALGLETAIGEPLDALAMRMGWIQEAPCSAACGVPTPKAGGEASMQSAEGESEEAEEDDDDDDPDPTAPVVLPRRLARELLFVGWSALELRIEPPALLPTVHARFGLMKKCLRFALEEVNLWSPTKADRDEIEFALQHGRPEVVLDAISSSLGENAGEFVPDPKPLQAPPKPASHPDLMSASARFVEELLTGGTWESTESTWRELERALERELIRPMMKEALITKDPQLKNSKLAAAGVGRLLQYQIAMLTARVARSIRKNGLASADLVTQSEIGHLCELMRQIEPLPPPGQDQRPRRRSANRGR